MLSPIVARAHAAGLRVSTHVATALDFAAAVGAGVDEINHLPLYLGPEFCGAHRASCVIDETTAARAAARRIVAVSTLARTLDEDEHDAAALAPRFEMERANFERLLQAGVPLAIGSDGISGEQPFRTALVEAWYLHAHGFGDNRTLLKLWCEATPLTIFPARRIGRLAPGYEASFLVLAGDPIADFARVKQIRRRVKGGAELVITRPPPR